MVPFGELLLRPVKQSINIQGNIFKNLKNLMYFEKLCGFESRWMRESSSHLGDSLVGLLSVSRRGNVKFVYIITVFVSGS